jgi:Fuc2NAc and GlcNAc transferase
MMLSAFLIFLVTFVAAALCTYVLTRCYIRYALRRGVIDTPNDRSSHTTPTPRGGGVSIVIVSLLLLAAAVLTDSPWFGPIPTSNIAALFVGGTLVAAIGFIDDVRSLSSKIRFSTHFIASVAALCLITPLPSLPLLGIELSPAGHWAIKGFWLFAAALGLTWLINLYNFMDGIDGIAATEGITVLLGAAFIGAAGSQHAFAWTPLILLTAPLIGFLILNWSPARIFMGDGCSGFLGITLGLLAIIYAANTPLNLWAWAILLGVFIVDACWTLTTRILTGQQWHQPHRSHCYQILSRKWRSHSKVTFGTGIINLLWLTPLALLSSLFPSYGWLCLLLAYGPLLVLCRAHGAGLHN